MEIALATCRASKSVYNDVGSCVVNCRENLLMMLPAGTHYRPSSTLTGPALILLSLRFKLVRVNQVSHEASVDCLLKDWERIFRKHNIGKQTHFGANFLRADWNTERQTYLIQFEDVTNPSDNFTFEAEVLISAIGGFSTPLIRPTGLPGIERFQGTCFHSARWDYNVDLEGKRVAVIGNGCSACQFIPKISQVTTTHVINFSRTPSWFVPRADKPFSSLQKNIFRYIPFYMKLYRAILVAESDFRWPVWVMKNKGFRRIAEQISTKHIKSVAPGKYHDFLLPKYPIGCKRIIVDPGYLQSLNQPNVELIYDPSKEITTSGVLCASGKEHEVDVLILATGFDLVSIM